MVNIRKIYVIFAVFLLLICSACKGSINNTENSLYKIIQLQDIPTEVSEWFNSFENKQAAYVYQHPNYTYIKISGGNNKHVVVKGFSDIDYIKTIYIEFNNKKSNKNSIYIKTSSDYISSYKVSAQDQDIQLQEKVIFGIIESPKIGDKISDTVNVKGKIAAFEGAFVIRIIDDNNRILKEEYGQTAGAPHWGAFNMNLKVPDNTAEKGRIELGEYSPKDGSYISHASNQIIFGR